VRHATWWMVALALALALSARATLADDAPSLFVLDGQELAATRELARAGQEPYAAAVASLRGQADGLLTQGPWSVMDKAEAPPSGDKHDYMSQSPYWWRNPATVDGLPYVEHDGKWNPEADKLDRQTFGTVCYAADLLAQAWFFTGDERYAARAALILRTWFLDPATRMNPHLNYAQRVPGICDGTFWGIIDSHSLTPLPDAIALLRGSKAWTADDQQGMEAWLGQYLDWLLTSVPGQAEGAARNNHGTWYDVQVVGLARFCGRDDVARRALERSLERMDYQFEADGRQPHELRRTKPLGYCVFNLRAWFDLACLAGPLGVDLWSYEAGEGETLRTVLDWVLPYLLGHEQLPAPDIVALDPGQTALLLRRAAQVWPDGGYEERLAGMGTAADPGAGLRADLLWPVPGAARSQL
jgi:hypothetical protein